MRRAETSFDRLAGWAVITIILLLGHRSSGVTDRIGVVDA